MTVRVEHKEDKTHVRKKNLGVIFDILIKVITNIIDINIC